MKPSDLPEAHQHFSAACFNEAWEYMEKPERDALDNEQMIRLAHASFYHWTQREDRTPTNDSIGYWQLARVHVLAGHYERARYYADRCIQVGAEHDLDPFSLAYGFEALARAEAATGNLGKARSSIEKARGLAEKVDDSVNKEQLLNDLDTMEVRAN